MAQVPLNGNPIFVDVLNEGGTIQVQSYPISELQSILGATLQAATIVTETQIQPSVTEHVQQAPPQMQIQIQPQVVVDIQTQSVLHSEAQSQLTLESQAEEPQQPFLDELKTVEIKVEEKQNPTVRQSGKKKTEAKNKPPRLKCPEDSSCRYTCESMEILERHIRKHRGENAFQCNFCGYSTYNKCLFEEHIRIHQGIKPFKCSFCPYKSASKKNTKKHELIHSPSNPRKCDQCDFVARHLKSLAVHKKSEHPELFKAEDIESEEDDKKYYCGRCAIQLKNKDLFKRHIKNHRRCLWCGIFFACGSKLRRHKIEMHGYKKAGQKSEPKGFTCAHCDWSSSNEVRILLHLIHHPDQEVDPEVVDISVLRKHGIMA